MLAEASLQASLPARMTAKKVAMADESNAQKLNNLDVSSNKWSRQHNVFFKFY
jgi:hypothetical protein